MATVGFKGLTQCSAAFDPVMMSWSLYRPISIPALYSV